MNNITPNSDFCEELRKAREFKGLSLESLARTTRIPIEYLKALEDGDFEVIPAAIRRGVIVEYAKAAGMNADKVLKSIAESEQLRTRSSSGSLDTERVLGESMTIGMTRVQIRTAWFAKIASNRPLHWGITLFFLIAAGFTSADWMRQSGGAADQKARIPILVVSARSIPFQRFEEAQIPPDGPRKSRNTFKTQVFTTDTGRVKATLGIDDWYTFELYPYDTIEFIHQTGLRIGFGADLRIFPTAESETFRTSYSKDSSEAWISIPDNRDSLDFALDKELPKPGS